MQQPCESRKPRRLRRLFPTMCCLLGAMALTSCAAKSAPVLTIPQPFLEPCIGPDTPVKSIGDLAVFSIRQEVALQDCEAKRAGLVKLVEVPKKKPWWKLW